MQEEAERARAEAVSWQAESQRLRRRVDLLSGLIDEPAKLAHQVPFVDPESWLQ